MPWRWSRKRRKCRSKLVFYRPRVEILEGRQLPSFIGGLNFDTGYKPYAVAVADFTGDGFQDLTVLKSGSNSVSVLLGNGDGTFQAARNFPVGPGCAAMAIGDFNGDGIPDLAVACDPRNVSVLLGNGDGTFQLATFTIGSPSYYPVGIAVGDFNGDGVQDLAVTTLSGPSAVLLGNGDGSFQPPRTFAAGSGPGGIAVGDFNGDGFQDLAVADNDYVAVLLGNGDGSFQPPRTFAAGINSVGLVVGDFNGDSVSDLAVTNEGTSPGYRDGSVSILLGNGDGTFQTAHNLSAGGRPWSVAIGDFNGDRVQDLAVADLGSDNYSAGSGVSVLLGNGDGSFQPAQHLNAGTAPTGIAVGDFDGDGIPDLAVANQGYVAADGSDFGNVSVLLGNGDGSFLTTPSYSAGVRPISTTVGDFNGDGIPDIAVANNTSNGTVSVLLGNGDGSFQAARTFAAGAYPGSMVAGDFNGDGIPDLALFSDNVVRVFLGNGDGTFRAARTFAAGSNPSGWVVGDFNGDGIPDLAVANDTNNGTVSVLLGNGDGSFQTPRTFAAGLYPRLIAVGDFNRDGIPDLAVTTADPNSTASVVSVFLGNGDGSFLPARTFAEGDNPESVVVGDFNGDGIPDLAAANLGHFVNDGGNVGLLLGNGDGTFQPVRTLVPGIGTKAVAIGDFNGDGIPDLAVSCWEGVKVLLGNGDGTFQPLPFGFAAGSFPKSLAVGDFNGDGTLDVATADVVSGEVSILLNDGVWPSGPGSPRDRRSPTIVSKERAHGGSRLPTRFPIMLIRPSGAAPQPLPAIRTIAHAPDILPAICTAPPGQSQAMLSPLPNSVSRHPRDAIFEEWENLRMELLEEK